LLGKERSEDGDFHQNIVRQSTSGLAIFLADEDIVLISNLSQLHLKMLKLHQIAKFVFFYSIILFYNITKFIKLCFF
jgi:hypothetical protein